MTGTSAGREVEVRAEQKAAGCSGACLNATFSLGELWGPVSAASLLEMLKHLCRTLITLWLCVTVSHRERKQIRTFA